MSRSAKRDALIVGKGYVTPAMMGRKLNMNISSIYKLIADGKLEVIRIADNVYVKITSIEAYLGDGAALFDTKDWSAETP